ncbi:MAG: adenylate/guanylate cyclase domain-containing protein [Rhodobacteraceae bacterium]|nr:adenylate/guanylate cyclase domain-containing protein [Paracoccaceae bacterium]
MKNRKTRLVPLSLGVLLTLAMVVLHGAATPLGLSARDAITDAYLRADPLEPQADRPVHVIDVDDASLAEIGQWPWPREQLAELTERLFDLGALAVGFDGIFPEPDRSSPPQAGGVGTATEGDALFATALRDHPTVLSVVGADAGGSPPVKAGIAWTGGDPAAALTVFPGHVGNLPVLTDAAHGLGSISLASSRDGIIRRVPMLSVMGNAIVPSLSAEMLRVVQDAGGYTLRTSEAQGETSGGTARPVALRIGAATVPLDGTGQMTVRFSRPEPSLLTPAAAILAPDGPDPGLRARIENRLVLVGSSAPGLFDIRATPLAAGIPGVTIHADIIEQVLQGAFLTRPDWMAGLERLVILLAGLSLTLCLVFERPIIGLALMTAWVGGAVLGGFWAFEARGLLFDPVVPALTGVLIFLPGAAAGVVQKERARRAVRARFAHFLPPDLIAQVADDPDHALTPEGAERVLTVMFIDIRGFSTITEPMTPTEVVTLVNRFLAEITRTLLAHGATIDKFMGDGVMAFWNAPIEAPGHEARAVAATFAVSEALARVNAGLSDLGLPEVSVGVGVNTGPCFVGLMGSSDRLSYTCIGDSVNLAARLEGLTRVYGVPACFGGGALAGLPGDLLAVELDLIAVKGRIKAEPVFAVLPDGETARGFAAALAAARAAYLRQDWDTAEQGFAEIAAITLPGCDLGGLAGAYRTRIAAWRTAPPPPGWDGHATATSK